MTDRHMLNESACPVPLDVLALLLRSDKGRIAEIVMSLAIPQRASLAAFCFSRCHMRGLGTEIAVHCDERSLRVAAGSAGEMLYERSRSRNRSDGDVAPSHKRPVTLARIAA